MNWREKPEKERKMGGSVNRVTLLGNVGRDPEIRTLNNGDRVANMTLATSESWRDKASGERKEKTEWHTVVCFNDNLTKVIENYVKKGSAIYVEGKLQTRKWEKDGVERYSTEIVLDRFSGVLTLIGGKSESGGGGSSSGFSEQGSERVAGRDRDRYDLNDDIPF